MAISFAIFWLLLQLLQLTSCFSSYKPLSDSSLSLLPSPGDTLDPHTGSLLAPILIPRTPGSEGSHKSLQHFTTFFKSLNWTVELNNFTDTTPISSTPVSFTNFIATFDPPWKRAGEVGRLLLVAHYDSKIEPDGFIGATDSAAPCAMLMHVAQAVTKSLTRKWSQMDDDEAMEDEMGLMVLLLDGEEAFKDWTDTDSIYGARHLAQHWDTTFHEALSTYRTHLSSVRLFILLDLLGAPLPNVPSFFQTTHWAYKHLSSIETKLRVQELLHTSKDHKAFLPDHEKSYFGFQFISDDHLPFLHRGVDVLHLIAYPFPTVWHHMDDDADHLDKNVVNDWAIIMNAFVVEWFGLEPFLDKNGEGKGTLGTAKINRTRRTEL